MPNFYVFTPKGKIRELTKFPATRECYKDCYVVSVDNHFWYKCWQFDLYPVLHWSPVGASSVPKKYLDHIKLIELIS